MPNHVINKVTVIGPGAHAFLLSLTTGGFFDFNKVVPIPKEVEQAESSSLVDDYLAFLTGKVPMFWNVHFPEITTMEQVEAKLREKAGSNTRHKQYLEKARQTAINVAKHGFRNWYDAHNALWGTKWNAYAQVFPQIPKNKRGGYGPAEQYKGHPSGRLGKMIRKAKTEKDPEFRINKRWRHETAYRRRVMNKWLKRYKVTEVHFDTAWSTPAPIWAHIAARLPPQLTIEVQYADEDLGSNCGWFTIVPNDFVNVNTSPGWGELDDEGKSKWVKFGFLLKHGPDANPADWGLDENYRYVG